MPTVPLQSAYYRSRRMRIRTAGLSIIGQVVQIRRISCHRIPDSMHLHSLLLQNWALPQLLPVVALPFYSEVDRLRYAIFLKLAELVFHIPEFHEAGYICAMLFIIPGFPFITSGICLAKLDLRSGLERLTYAIIIVMVATLFAWIMALYASGRRRIYRGSDCRIACFFSPSLKPAGTGKNPFFLSPLVFKNYSICALNSSGVI